MKWWYDKVNNSNETRISAWAIELYVGYDRMKHTHWIENEWLCKWKSDLNLWSVFIFSSFFKWISKRCVVARFMFSFRSLSVIITTYQIYIFIWSGRTSSNQIVICFCHHKKNANVWLLCGTVAWDHSSFDQHKKITNKRTILLMPKLERKVLVLIYRLKLCWCRVYLITCDWSLFRFFFRVEQHISPEKNIKLPDIEVCKSPNCICSLIKHWSNKTKECFKIGILWSEKCKRS